MALIEDVFLYRTITAIDGSDEDVVLEPGARYDLDTKARRLVDRETGEAFLVEPHMCQRAEWYFGTGRGGFASRAPRVTIEQLVGAVVAANPDLMSAELMAIAANGSPLPRFPSYNVFTAQLANHPRVRKFKDGAEVLGTTAVRGHVKDMTYRMS